MANAIELLYFIQQQGPVYMQSLEQELDVTGRARAGGLSAVCAGPLPTQNRGRSGRGFL